MTKRLAGLCLCISTVMGALFPFAVYWSLSASLPRAFSAWWIHYSPYFSLSCFRENLFLKCQDFCPGVKKMGLFGFFFFFFFLVDMQLGQWVCNSLAAPWASWRREWNVKFFNITPIASPFTGEKTCRYQLGIFRKRKKSTLFQLWKGTRLKSFVPDGQGYAGVNRRPESLSPTVCFSCPP